MGNRALANINDVAAASTAASLIKQTWSTLSKQFAEVALRPRRPRRDRRARPRGDAPPAHQPRVDDRRRHDRGDEEHPGRAQPRPATRSRAERSTMELGFSTMNTPEDVRPDVLARELEDRGYTSLFIGEHSHIPASRRTPYPSGGEMPDQYRRMMDPFVSLTMAAPATERLQLGLGVCLVLEHHVLDLAKSVATLDLLSGGRVLFGVGRRLERRGAREPPPRHHVGAAVPGVRGVRRRAAALLDRRGVVVPRRVLRLRRRCGRSRSRRSGRTRRCCSARAASSARSTRCAGPTSGCRWTSRSVARAERRREEGHQVPRGRRRAGPRHPDLARDVRRPDARDAPPLPRARHRAHDHRRQPRTAGTTRRRRCRSSTATPP